jgi:acyl carrier protein
MTENPMTHPDPDPATLERWLTGRIAAYGDVDPATVRPDSPLADLGLDSVFALTLCGDVEDEFGVDVDPTIAWDHPTLGALAAELAARIAADGTAGA